MMGIEKPDICPNCGNRCTIDEVYCPKCGKNLDELFEQLDEKDLVISPSKSHWRSGAIAGKVFMTCLSLMLILAVWLTVRFVPGLHGLSNPNSLAIEAGFAEIFILVCFLPVILLADLAGIIFTRTSVDREDRRRVLWVLVIGNSLIPVIAVMIDLDSIIQNSIIYGATAVFMDVSQGFFESALFQSLLIFLGPTLATILLCAHWLRKDRFNPSVIAEDKESTS
jgi:hypothetical protein